MTWQPWPEWYYVKAVFYNGSIASASIVCNSTLKDPASFEVTSLEPDTVYNISVTPCNMAECNVSCDVHSVQTKSGGSGGIGVEGEMAQFAHIQIVHTLHYDLCLYLQYSCCQLNIECRMLCVFVIYNKKAIFSQSSQIHVAC